MSSGWLKRHGLGPTRLISPFNTFHSWGNSSSLVRRRNRPKGVTASALARWLATLAVFLRMVRNFTRVKGRLWRPTRCWKKTGDPLSKNPINVTSRSTGAPRTIGVVDGVEGAVKQGRGASEEQSDGCQNDKQGFKSQ